MKRSVHAAAISQQSQMKSKNAAFAGLATFAIRVQAIIRINFSGIRDLPSGKSNAQFLRKRGLSDSKTTWRKLG
jgi:hypothetical protein